MVGDVKKNHKKQRKLRKCERGIKTKAMNKGCRYALGCGKLRPIKG